MNFSFIFDIFKKKKALIPTIGMIDFCIPPPSKYKQLLLTPEEKVLRLLKYDFEKKVGISFEQFICVYKEILKNNPEKLI